MASPYTGFTGQVQQALRPFPQYSFIANDCCLQNIGQSTYHALVTSIERRFTNGLNLQASYTWAKNITDADSILPGIDAGISQFQNSFDHHDEKSISTQDIPHTVVLSYLYELPVGKGRRFLNDNKLLDLALGGWEIGGVQRYQSGQPISFVCQSSIPGQDNCIRDSLTGTSFKSAAYANGQKINPFGQNKSFFNIAVDPTNSANLIAPAFFNQNDPIHRATRGGAYAFGDMPRVTGAVRTDT